MKKYPFIALLFIILMARSAKESKLNSDLNVNPRFDVLSKYLQQDALRLLKPLINLFEITKELLVIAGEYHEAAQNAPATYNQRNDDLISDAVRYTHRLYARMMKGYSPNSGINIFEIIKNNGFFPEEWLMISDAFLEANRLMDERLPTDSNTNKKCYFDRKKKFYDILKDFEIASKNVSDITVKLLEEISDYISIRQTCRDLNKNLKSLEIQLLFLFVFNNYYIEMYLSDLFDKKILDNEILEEANSVVSNISEELLEILNVKEFFSRISSNKKYLIDSLSKKMLNDKTLAQINSIIAISEKGSALSMEEMSSIISSICENCPKSYLFCYIKDMFEEMIKL